MDTIDKILTLRKEGLSYRAIATEVGLSHERVRQILNPKKYQEILAKKRLPEGKEKIRKYRQRPEVKEKLREYRQRPEVKERMREYYRKTWV
jgi:lambda repressor-like predicted transcriptional regulator